MAKRIQSRAMDGSSPVVIFVYLRDVDATVVRATERGAAVLSPAQDQFWGNRIASIMDYGGHVWTIATVIEQTTAEKRTRRWDKELAERRGTPPPTRPHNH